MLGTCVADAACMTFLCCPLLPYLEKFVRCDTPEQERYQRPAFCQESVLADSVTEC